MQDGLAMASPISPPVANLFMEELESKALASFKKGKPKHWRRYVDDVLAVIKASVANKSLIHLNSQHSGVTFTMEIQLDGHDLHARKYRLEMTRSLSPASVIKHFAGNSGVIYNGNS